jgi:hypothetical protein
VPTLLDRILPWRTATPTSLAASLTMRPHPRGALVASATVINPQEGQRLTKASRNREWQRASFGYARALPEVGFALRFLANNSGHVRLIVGDRRPGADEVEELNDDYGIADPTTGALDDDTLPPDLVEAARQALDLLTGASPSGGGSAILAPIVRNLETVGEYYLVGRYDPTANSGRGAETWAIHSISEVRFEDGKLPGSPDTLPDGTPFPRGYFRLITGEGRTAESVDLDPTTTTVVRGWTADAEWSAEPDSPMRSLVGVCERLLLIEKGDDAALRSRAAGNGMVLWPEELDTIPDDADDEDDDFDRDFVTQLTTPLTLDGSAAQVVPMIKRGAYQYLDRVRHLTFGRPLDPLTSDRETKLLARLGIGLDVPPEVITGLADTNHWNAWQITSDLFRHHQEPITIAAVEGLSIGYLRARLTAANRWDPGLIRRLVIWYDASDLIAPADMSAAADAAHDRGLITDAAYRALRGIGEEHAPPDEQQAGTDPVGDTGLSPDRLAQVIGIAQQAILAGFDPLSVTQALGLDMIEHTGHLPTQARETIASDTPPADSPTDTEPDAAPAEGPNPEPPALPPGDGQPPPASAATAILAAAATEQSRRLSRRLTQIERTLRERIAVAADAALARALERAGNRARAAAQRHTDARETVTGRAPEQVLASLGRPLVAALGLEEQQLLAEAFSKLREQYTEWTLTAAEEAIDTAVQLAGLDRADPQVQRYIAGLRDRFADNVDASWPTLETGLNDLAADRLYDPDPAAPEVGELPAGQVPPGLVRGALALAGGLHSDATGRPPLNGLTSGQLLDGFLRDAGCEIAEYEWSYGISARPFPPHAALDGLVFTGFDDDALSTAGTGASWIGGSFAPGDHKGCVIGETVVSGPRARASFTRWYDGPGVEVLTESGKRLTATPNHPVLTLTGWCPAGDLAEGDYVIAQLGSHGIPVDEDVQQVPAPIHEVAASLPMLDDATGGEVPTAPEDFHGDGVGSDGQVTVIRADRRLLLDGEPPAAQQIRDLSLTGTGDTEWFPIYGHALPSERRAPRLLIGSLPTPDRRVSRGDKRSTILGGAVGVAEPLSLGEPAQLDTEPGQVVGDRAPVTAIPDGETLRTFTGEITLDKISVIRHVPLSTHVYNLSTDTGWYVANGIIISNCHCDYVPVYTDGADTRAAMERISRTAHVEQYPDRPLPTRQATNDPKVYRPERITRPPQIRPAR